MLKKILLCLAVTSLYCSSFCGNEVNAMESVSQESKSKEKNVIKDGCVLCEANPDKLFSLKRFNECVENKHYYYYQEIFRDIDDFVECFYRFLINYNNMWDTVLELQKSEKCVICCGKHYRIGQYNFEEFLRIIKSWNEWVDEADGNNHLMCSLDHCRCIPDYDKYYVREYISSIKESQDFFSQYFTRSCDKGEYLLQADPFHKVIMNEFCNAKLLDKEHIEYFFGSKNFYEALIVSLIRFKLSTLSIDELLFNIENGNIACFEFNDKIDKFLDSKNILDCLLILEKFKLNNKEFLNDIGQSNNTPLIISQLNNSSYISYKKVEDDYFHTNNYFYTTDFDSEKLNSKNLTSNLEKVLSSFNFCKLKFNFKLDNKELKIIDSQKNSIPDFLAFVFESKYIDIINLDLKEPIEYYDEFHNHIDLNPEIFKKWCTGILKTLCNSTNDLNSCELFKYIDNAIQNKKDFLRNLLVVSKFFCNEFEEYKMYHSDYDNKENTYTRDDLYKLKNALLKYYKNVLPQDKFEILEQFDIDNNITNDEK